MDDAQRDAVGRQMFKGLNDIYRGDKELCIGTVSAFLDYHQAGCPEVPLFLEQVRVDAKLWADCASQHELEAYAFAAIDALDKSNVSWEKQTKRLAAMSWRRLTASGKAAFKNWIETNGK